MLLFKPIFMGLRSLVRSLPRGRSTPAGVVMLATLPILLGLQFILAFSDYEVVSVQKTVTLGEKVEMLTPVYSQ